MDELKSESKPKSKKLKYIVIGLGLYGLLCVVFLVISPYIPKYSTVKIINTSGTGIECFVDGEKQGTSSVRGDEVLSVRVKCGEHELVIKHKGANMLQEKRNFEQEKLYIAYCGYAWMTVSYVRYGVPSFEMADIPGNVAVYRDGQKKLVPVETKAEFERLRKLLNDGDAVYTKPCLEVFEKNTEFIMPYESVPEKGEFASSKTVFRVMKSGEIESLRRYLDKAE